MSIIERAIKNSPALAAITIFVFGASAAIAAVGILVPDLFKVAINVLLGMMITLGVMYLVVNRKGKASASPFGLPRVMGIQIMWGMRRHSLVWIAA